MTSEPAVQLDRAPLADATPPRLVAATDLRGAAREIVHRTCREQGMPVKVTDPAILARVAALLDTAEASRARRNGHAGEDTRGRSSCH